MVAADRKCNHETEDYITGRIRPDPLLSFPPRNSSRVAGFLGLWADYSLLVNGR